MVDRVEVFEVFEVADRLRALRGKEAVRVSVRRVRENLKRKGSFGDVGKELKDWKNARSYHPVIELMQLPDALEKRIGDFGRALLDEVQASESRVRDVERANFEVERANHRELLDEAGMTIDALEARVAALTAEVARLRKDGATEAVERQPVDEATLQRRQDLAGKGAVMDAAMSLSRDRAVMPGAQEAFWRSVETEVLALLRKRGPMPAGSLLIALPEDLLNRGKNVEMPLSVGWLRYRLRVMIEAGKPLVEIDGRFMPAEKAKGAAPPAKPAEGGVRSPPPSLGDAVMWEVERVLLEQGPLMPAQIRELLPARVHAAAKKHWQDGLKRLGKDMTKRSSRGYYFKDLEDGRFAALEGDEAETPPGDAERSA
ncbi:hypothetical protein ASF22_19355 [Methylobacterium sp. Leaf87]|nr:hypothetical protein ASF22_19355 [Methylobacterium sp. Leaf87]